MEQQISEINSKIDYIIENLSKIKDELMNNKDNVKKLYEIADEIENLQAELIAIKGFSFFPAGF